VIGVLLLQGQENNVRNRFGHLVGDEKLDGEELTVDGGRCSRDPMKTTDDGKTWGKTIARPRRLATRKESRNGMVKRRLAAVSGRWHLTSALGKSCEGWWGGDLMPVSPVASR
jgi:hypothetical protein